MPLGPLSCHPSLRRYQGKLYLTPLLCSIISQSIAPFVRRVDDSYGSRKAVHRARSVTVQEGRMQLPVCKMEQEIVEAVNANDVNSRPSNH